MYKIGLILCGLILASEAIRYKPTWESLDSRPLPAWYDESKIGIFIHWGVFSVPSYLSEWFWYYWKGPKPWPQAVQFMEDNYKPDWTYQDFAKDFTTEFFDADEWAELFNASGARYVVQVSKHHEGFTSWPSAYSFNWNAKDVGPNRDLVGELATAIRKRTNIHYGMYHSLFEWFNPLYLKDKANNYTTDNFVNSKTLPELYELVKRYKPEVVWSDGIDHGTDDYWHSKNFLAWLYNDSPVKDTVVVNDRWGDNCICKHGGYFTCTDRFNPKTVQKFKWEGGLTIDKRSWGFVRNSPLSSYLTIQDIITRLVQVVSCGGNLLINVGPTKEGTISPIFQERLLQMGSWLKVNGEAIYKTSPWRHQNDTVNPDVWYTTPKDNPAGTVFAMALKWPSGGRLQLGSPVPSSQTQVSLLGYRGPPFLWTHREGGGMDVTLPPIPITHIPCRWAWVFRLTKVG